MLTHGYGGTVRALPVPVKFHRLFSYLAESLLILPPPPPPTHPWRKLAQLNTLIDMKETVD